MLGKSLLTRKVQIYLRKFTLILKILLFFSIICSCLFVAFVPLPQKFSLRLSSALVQSGFYLGKVVVEDCLHLSREEIYSFIDYSDQNSIFEVDLLSISKKVKSHPWVKSCIVKRCLPNTLCIKMLEHVPIAIWQYQYKHHLIDRDGECIGLEGLDFEQFSNLINVVGKGANLYADQLIKDMSYDPLLKAKVKVAVRCGERRWDIFLGEILIKMPEQNFVGAWKYLSQMREKGVLLDCGIKTMDLRNERKFYLEYR